MKQLNDPLPRRTFFKALGAVAAPLLIGGCDDEPSAAEFRAGPRFRLRAGEVEVGRALLEQVLINDRQRCSLPAKLGALAGVGQQVRLSHPEYGSALYTVDELREDDNPDYVRMSLSARLRIGCSEGFVARISNRLTVDMSDAEAEANSEFVERVVDPGANRRLVVLAPHGGGVEPQTDEQAERLADKLRVSSWICKGWSAGGGAFDRWHIRSTDLHPRSFPGLAGVARRRFDYAVAFHGMDVGGVLIGGGGPRWLKHELAEAIRAVVDARVEVGVASPDDVYDGDSPDNIVNWMTERGTGGIQIEQSRDVRLDHADAIVDAIASVFARIF